MEIRGSKTPNNYHHKQNLTHAILHLHFTTQLLYKTDQQETRCTGEQVQSTNEETQLDLGTISQTGVCCRPPPNTHTHTSAYILICDHNT